MTDARHGASSCFRMADLSKFHGRPQCLMYAGDMPDVLMILVVTRVDLYLAYTILRCQKHCVLPSCMLVSCIFRECMDVGQCW